MVGEEAGADLRLGRLVTGVMLFRNDVHNLIGSRNLADSELPPGFFFGSKNINVGKVRSEGVEFTSEYVCISTKPHHQCSLYLYPFPPSGESRRSRFHWQADDQHTAPLCRSRSAMDTTATMDGGATRTMGRPDVWGFRQHVDSGLSLCCRRECRVSAEQRRRAFCLCFQFARPQLYRHQFRLRAGQARPSLPGIFRNAVAVRTP